MLENEILKQLHALKIAKHCNENSCSMRCDVRKIFSVVPKVFLMKNIAKKINVSEDKFWIGLNDRQAEAQWQWVDNTPLDQNKTYEFSLNFSSLHCTIIIIGDDKYMHNTIRIRIFSCPH